MNIICHPDSCVICSWIQMSSTDPSFSSQHLDAEVIHGVPAAWASREKTLASELGGQLKI